MGKPEVGTIALIIAIASALAALGSILTAKKPDAITNDDRPDISASRGAYVPLIIGRQRVGELFLWVQPDSPVGANFVGGSPESASSGYGKGMGGGAPSTQTYQERGLHALCVGPASKLHAIFQNGKRIWEGPISPWSHPSGSAITIPNEGTFKIWWGFDDDPIVSYIDVASNHGTATKYPLVTKILWDKKELGTQRQWPRLEYEVECPCRSHLANTPALLPESYDDTATRVHPTLTPTVIASIPCWEDWFNEQVSSIYRFGTQLAEARPVIDILEITGGPEWSQTRTIRIGDRLANNTPGNPARQSPDFSQTIFSGDVVKVYGNGQGVLSAQTLATMFPGSTPIYTGVFMHVLKAEYDPFHWVETAPGSNIYNRVPPQAPTSGIRHYTGTTKITLGPVTRWPVSNATTQPAAQTPKLEVVARQDSGAVNPIHAISQIMFAPAPYGASLEREPYDIASMEEAAMWFQVRERFRCALSITEGETAKEVVARVMQDIGLFISWEPSLGLYVFKLIRHPGLFGQEALAEIPASCLLAAPEIGNTQSTLLRDRVLFTYQDSTRNYRDDPILIDDDGTASREERQQVKTAQITSTNDRESALIVAKRRAQEVQSNQNLVDLKFNHESRWMFPGLSFVSPAAINDEVPMRVMTIKRDPNTSKNEMKALLDCYDPPSPFSGNDDSSFAIETSGGLATDEAGPTVDNAAAVLEVPRALSNGKIRFIFPRLRAGAKTTESRVWLSRDGSSYVLAGTDRSLFSGGFLEQAMSSSPADLDDGSLIIYGASDMLRVEDLSALEESFQLGRQLLIVGNELCYLRRVVALGDNRWEISRGLLRGRLDTPVTAHAAGTPVFVIRAHEVQMFESLLFQPGRTCFVKLQPIGPGGGVTLDNIEPIEFDVVGNAALTLPFLLPQFDDFASLPAAVDFEGSLVTTADDGKLYISQFGFWKEVTVAP